MKQPLTDEERRVLTDPAALGEKPLQLTDRLVADLQIPAITFQHARIRDVDFQGVEIRGAQFRDTHLEGVSFKECEIATTTFAGGTFSRCSFEDVQLCPSGDSAPAAQAGCASG
jgi:uncharacterized protein YjbI with pentapeptide repeats